jgi:hypothetical protein
VVFLSLVHYPRVLRFPVAVNASNLGPAPSGLLRYALGLVRSLDPLREGLVVYTSYPEVSGQRCVGYLR